MTTLEQLDAAVKAVAPIHGVAILRPERGEPGWDVTDAPIGRVRIDFTDDATEEQKAAARAVVQVFVATPEKTKAERVADLKRLSKDELDTKLLELLAERME